MCSVLFSCVLSNKFAITHIYTYTQAMTASRASPKHLLEKVKGLSGAFQEVEHGVPPKHSCSKSKDVTATVHAPQQEKPVLNTMDEAMIHVQDPVYDQAGNVKTDGNCADDSLAAKNSQTVSFVYTV